MASTFAVQNAGTGLMEAKDLSGWIDEFGVGPVQYRILLAGGGVWWLSGSILFAISGMVKLIKDEWELKADWVQGLIVSFIFIL